MTKPKRKKNRTATSDPPQKASRESKPPSPSSHTRPSVATGVCGWRAVGILAIIHVALAVSSAVHKSPTFDEMAHFTGGHHYWLYNDYRLNPENGNLSQRLAAFLPALTGNFSFPEAGNRVWERADVWMIGYPFFYQLGNDPERMLMLGRVVIVLLGVGILVLVFAWSRDLFGRRGGMISLIVAAFSPTLLAHDRLTTSDVCLSLTFLIALYCLWTALHRISIGSLAASTLAMAAVILAKMSGVLIVPIAFLLLALIGWRRPAPEVSIGVLATLQKRRGNLALWLAFVCVHAAVVFVVIWAAYGFRYNGLNRQAIPIGSYQSTWEDVTERGEGVVPRILTVVKNAKLLPEAFLFGFAHVATETQGRPAFVNGRHSHDGFWYFFPYCFLVKTPTPILALLFLSLVGLCSRLRSRDQSGSGEADVQEPFWLRTAPLWLFVVMYGAVSLASNLNIGHRHILPLYPPLFILVGAAAWFCDGFPRTGKPLVALCAAGLLAGNLMVWPNYLAYFNVLAGGPANGYKRLVDSSLDWGQDLAQLKDWLRRHHDMDDDNSDQNVYLAYFGTGSPEYYRIEATNLPGYFDFGRERSFGQLAGGVYCISATILQSMYTSAFGPWTDAYEAQYQELLVVSSEFEATADDPAERNRLLRQRGPAFWNQTLDLFERFRLARVCAHLRRREPDDHVGYSILIYRVSHSDAAAFVSGPAPL